VLHGLGNDNEAVRERVTMNVADVRDHTVLWHRARNEARAE
jgi:hypothetical protein